MATPLEPGGTSEPRLDARRANEMTAACLVVALDGAQPLAPPSRHWLLDVDEVRLCRSVDDRRRRHDREPPGTLTLWLTDPMVSGRHAVLRRSQGHWTLTDEGSRNGTLVNGKSVNDKRLADGDMILVGSVAMVFRKVALQRRPERLDEAANHLYPRGLPRGLWTMSPSLERTFMDLLRIARARTAVVIMGETGAGKELAAEAIHTLSGRTGALVAVNCGELPAELISRELFGHKRGAFTDAHADKDGLVTASSGGTLFLDEIVELPLATQASLLRALQEGEVRPVGATATTKVDLRVVAATHADVPALVRAGSFREDLWSRLAGHELHLPALRDRKDDLGLLLAGFLEREAPGRPLTLSYEATAALAAYDWPRNIRRLEQVVDRAVRLTDDDEIRLQHLPDELRARPAEGRDQLVELLRRHKGNTVKVAEEVGVTRQAIEKRCKASGIDYKVFRTDDGRADEDG